MDSLHVALYGANAKACFSSLRLDSDFYTAQTTLNDAGLPPGLDSSEMLIVFFDESIDQIQVGKKLAASPQFHAYAARICVFCFAPKFIENQLALQFNDFMFFPCNAGEFRLRLEMLKKQCLPQPAHRSHTVDQQSLLEEFSNLNLRGNSTVFTDTLSLIKQTAKCDASVLIEGETGTGKENAARAIHYLGKRQDAAFVPINCGAIPDNLLESELFGYEKGAFTDARQKQAGLVALAHNGTLFLDEVDSLSPKAQAALLRFLQTGEYRSLGGGITMQSNVRVIAATNANLADCVQRREFREDLYFRLNVLCVRMPPLRERPSDIEVIANHLVRRFFTQYGNGPTTIHPSALRELQRRQWPGNVRELENVLLREFLLCPGDQILIGRDDAKNAFHNLPPRHKGIDPIPFQEAKEAAISEFECSYLKNILAITEGNVTEAARLAGKERRCLGKLIKKYKIDKSKFAGHSASA